MDGGPGPTVKGPHSEVRSEAAHASVSRWGRAAEAFTWSCACRAAHLSFLTCSLSHPESEAVGMSFTDRLTSSRALGGL